MTAAIIGVLTALPEIISLLKEIGVGLTKFWEWINHVSGNDPSGYIVKIGEAFAQLNKAQSKDEHADAAKAIAELLHGLDVS